MEYITLIGKIGLILTLIAGTVLMNREQKLSMILPVGKDQLAEDDEILKALNDAAKTLQITKESVNGLKWNLEWTKVHQNTPHHMEGWLYNHIILMLYALQYFWDTISEEEYSLLEEAIFWSDLGKYHTTKESPKKVWEDGELKGEPVSTAFGHDKKSAQLYEEAGGSNPAVHFIVAEHMKAHKLSEMDEEGKTEVPEFLMPQVADLDAWNWPNWEDLEIPHGESFGKKLYAWVKLGNCELLRIKQECDSNGRIPQDPEVSL